MRRLLLYDLSVEAQEHLKSSGLSKRELIRRLGTSPAQLYRLLDQTNYSKTVDSMLALLRALDCNIEVVVKDRSA
jgi:DNA-binding Xre family transcriptional regulator